MIRNIKLSQSKYRIDEFNSLVIEIDDKTILKISELELITIASSIMKNQTGESKLFIANNAFNLLLEFLEIPKEITQKIEAKKTEKKQEQKYDGLKAFIQTYVNQNKKTEEFEFDDFKEFEEYKNIEELINVIEEKGFKTEKLTKTAFKISIGD